MAVGTADLQLDSLITVILASGPGIPLLCLGSTEKWFRFFEYWLCTGGGRGEILLLFPVHCLLPPYLWCAGPGGGREPESAFPSGPLLPLVFGWISFLLLRRQIAGGSWGFRYEGLAWS